MTTVKIFQSKNDGSYRGFVCKGHAGYADEGEDIVCAAISILVINTINSIEIIAGQKFDGKEGDGFIECKFNENLNDASVVLVKAMILGLEGIKQQYGKKYLKLIFKEV